jgi:FKBP-type peptidyl-prolyl cis-trans isomerase 2
MLFAFFSPSLNTCVTVCCSHDRGQPLPLTRAPSLSESSFFLNNTLFSLVVGVGQVIKGWDEGLVGMCVGEKRILTIPSDMAYGVYNMSVC